MVFVMPITMLYSEYIYHGYQWLQWEMVITIFACLACMSTNTTSYNSRWCLPYTLLYYILNTHVMATSDCNERWWLLYLPAWPVWAQTSQAIIPDGVCHAHHCVTFWIHLSWLPVVILRDGGYHICLHATIKLSYQQLQPLTMCGKSFRPVESTHFYHYI